MNDVVFESMVGITPLSYFEIAIATADQGITNCADRIFFGPKRIKVSES